MSKYKKSGVFVLSFLLTVITAACCLLAVIATRNGYDGAGAQTAQTPSTSLQITVKDLRGNTIEGATVTIVENGASCKTGADGKTPVISVPFVDTPLTSEVDGGFSFVTVVVSKQGYVDYILYNCLVYRDRTRNGPSITMFGVTETSSPFVSTVEVPPEEWTKEFLSAIKKQSK